MDISPICNVTVGGNAGFCGVKGEEWLHMADGVQILEGIPFFIVGAGRNAYGADTYKRIAMHRMREKEILDPELINEFAVEAAGRLDRGEIGWSHYRRIKRGTERLIEFYQTGKMEWSCPGKVSKFKLNDYYERIINDFLAASAFHPNTQGDVVWVSRKYFAWLIGEGHNDLSAVGAEEIQGFIGYCSRHMTIGSVHNTKLYLKRLYEYLACCGLSVSDYKQLLSFKVIRGSRIFPAASPDDVASILNQVDRRIPAGKRDYAIVLLGSVTGLRAIDIARLRLSDIDWQRGEIKLVQAKTGKSLALPLTRDVGESVQDYILHGRQHTEVKEIFLRYHRPYQEIYRAGQYPPQRMRRLLCRHRAGLHGCQPEGRR